MNILIHTQPYEKINSMIFLTDFKEMTSILKASKPKFYLESNLTSFFTTNNI